MRLISGPGEPGQSDTVLSLAKLQPEELAGGGVVVVGDAHSHRGNLVLESAFSCLPKFLFFFLMKSKPCIISRIICVAIALDCRFLDKYVFK